LRQPTADLAAFDVPVSDPLLSQALNLRVLRFPAAVGGVVPICNIGGTLQTVNLSGELLAAVFLGKITRWDDSALLMLNRQTVLPYAQINVIHRSDSSDETWLFTQYLSAASPDWKARIAASPSVAWPVGIGATGNGGVLQLVKETAGSIGYVDASFAFQNGLVSCAVLNRAGRAVKASPESLSAAATALATAASPDFSASILDASGHGAYPIASLVWLAVREQLPDQDKREAMRSFLGWMLNRGQPDGAALGYGSLPAPLVGREQSLIDRVR
jgi:phosphate transport system substrate-binding protein